MSPLINCKVLVLTYPPDDFRDAMPSALPTLLLRLMGIFFTCGSGLFEDLEVLDSEPALETGLEGDAETFLRNEFLRRLERCSSSSRSLCFSTLANCLA